MSEKIVQLNNVLSSLRKYTREILHSSRERDFDEQDSMLVPY